MDQETPWINQNWKSTYFKLFYLDFFFIIFIFQCSPAAIQINVDVLGQLHPIITRLLYFMYKTILVLAILLRRFNHQLTTASRATLLCTRGRMMDSFSFPCASLQTDTTQSIKTQSDLIIQTPFCFSEKHSATLK